MNCKNCLRQFNCGLTGQPAWLLDGVSNLYRLFGKKFPVKVVNMKGKTVTACSKYAPDELKEVRAK